MKEKQRSEIDSSYKWDLSKIYKSDEEVKNAIKKAENLTEEVLKYKGMDVYVNEDDIKLDKGSYLDEELIGLSVIYEDNIKGIIKDIERYDKMTLFVIKGDKEYLIPYNDNLIDKIDIDNKKIYIKDIKGLFD